MNKDTSYTLVPVNRILKIFLLTNFKCKNNSIVPYHSILKSVTLIFTIGVINTIFLINKLEYFISSNGHSRFHNSIESIYWLGYFEYITDMFYMYRTRHSFLKYLEFYKTIDRLIQVPDFSAIRGILTKILVCFVLFFIIITTFDYVSWCFGFGWKITVLYSVGYFYNFINYLTVIDVISQIIQIEYRLKILVTNIEKYQDRDFNNDDNEQLVIESTVIGIWVRPAQSRHMSPYKVDKVHSFTKFYLLLTDQVAYINKAFGVRLLIFMLFQLILLIHLANLIIRDTIGLLVTTYPSYHLPALSNSCLLTLAGSVQLILVYRCEQTYKQSQKVTNIIDEILITNRNMSGELKTALAELQELIRSRSIKFQAAGFFTFNYPLLASVASAIATYTIILLQTMQ